MGNGVHLANAEDAVREFCRAACCPVLSTWTGADIVPDLELHIGHFGIFGDRASNFVVQNADYLLVIGASLCMPQTGYNAGHFAREAQIEHADPIALPSAGGFSFPKWNKRALDWKEKYGIEKEERPSHRPGEHLNSFDFVRQLSQELPSDAIVVTDMGTAFTCTFQAARMKYGQRWLTASGFAPMGYGLPGAIGAHYATGKRVTCIVGDGSIMFSLACLKTIGDDRLPIDIIVIDNGGYLALKHTQMNHFGRFVGAEFTNPQWADLFRAFRLPPPLVVYMDPMQPLTPRTSSFKRPDGSITSRPLEDMYPFLPREELREQMIVPPLEAM